MLAAIFGMSNLGLLECFGLWGISDFLKHRIDKGDE